MLELIRAYAATYISKLPDFTCLQETEQFQAGKRSDRWRKGDKLSARLLFTGGREERTLEEVNGRGIKPGSRYRLRRPLTTEGEFGILLANVLGPSSAAQFTWKSFEKHGDTEGVVFDYAIDQHHSTMKLSRGDLASAIVPYHGSLHANRSTGEVYRITSEASEIPPEVGTRHIFTEISYDTVEIGQTKYLLPAVASVEMVTEFGKLRNKLAFHNYQKFEADSQITFGRTEKPPL